MDLYSNLNIIFRSIRWQHPNTSVILEFFVDIGIPSSPRGGAHTRKVHQHGQCIGALQSDKTSHQLVKGLILQAITLVYHEKTFLRLPNDVFLITNEILRCLGHVDLLITSWPCHSHSCVRAGHGSDDPNPTSFGSWCGSCIGGSYTNPLLLYTFWRMYHL